MPQNNQKKRFFQWSGKKSAQNKAQRSCAITFFSKRLNFEKWSSLNFIIRTLVFAYSKTSQNLLKKQWLNSEAIVGRFHRQSSDNVIKHLKPNVNALPSEFLKLEPGALKFRFWKHLQIVCVFHVCFIIKMRMRRIFHATRKFYREPIHHFWPIVPWISSIWDFVNPKTIKLQLKTVPKNFQKYVFHSFCFPKNVFSMNFTPRNFERERKFFTNFHQKFRHRNFYENWALSNEERKNWLFENKNRKKLYKRFWSLIIYC